MVLDVLTGLVDNSLVVVDRPGGATRYRLLETIREYAAERLETAAERDATSERHARFYLGLAEQAEAELHGADQLAWLERLALEHDNLRVALEWWEDHERPDLGLRLGSALWPFWWFRGHVKEGRSRLQRLLAAAELAPEHITPEISARAPRHWDAHAGAG